MQTITNEAHTMFCFIRIRSVFCRHSYTIIHVTSHHVTSLHFTSHHVASSNHTELFCNDGSAPCTSRSASTYFTNKGRTVGSNGTNSWNDGASNTRRRRLGLAETEVEMELHVELQVECTEAMTTNTTTVSWATTSIRLSSCERSVRILWCGCGRSTAIRGCCRRRPFERIISAATMATITITITIPITIIMAAATTTTILGFRFTSSGRDRTMSADWSNRDLTANRKPPPVAAAAACQPPTAC